MIQKRKSEPNLFSYASLKERIKETLLFGQQRINQERLHTYWDTGQSLHRHLLQFEDQVTHGKRVILKLAEDLKVGDELLYRALRFYQAFPISSSWRKLSWSHYRVLARVPDKKKRLELASRAERLEWAAEDLEAEVKKINKRMRESNNGGTKKTPELLIPKRGKIGVFQLVEDGSALALDLGFTSYLELEEPRAAKWKASDLVSFTGERMEKAKEAKVSDLFTYEAELVRVVDGDTYWMKIWIKRPQFLKEKLRLRGVDTPELGTPEGEAAKRFVERLFKKAQSITITTTKPDDWDRYLSDIFLRLRDADSEKEEIFLNNDLLEKGYARRKDRYVIEDWDKK